MVESLRVLLAEIFDYAGLFPPAALPMDQAVTQYISHTKGPECGLVNRFVCPVSWLDDFWQVAEGTDTHFEWNLTVLGTSLEGFRQDQSVIQTFLSRTQGRVQVSGYEVKAAPKDVSVGTLKPLASAAFDDIFIELPWTEDATDALHTIAEADGPGAKARTGGLEPSNYPSTEQLAAFIQECVNLELSFKLTAGLHHPLRHKHASIDAFEHGFLNVLVATVLAHAQDLNKKEIASILGQSNLSDFTAEEDELIWGDWEATTEDIHDARESIRGIGSCSISEPLSDLKALNLW